MSAPRPWPAGVPPLPPWYGEDQYFRLWVLRSQAWFPEGGFRRGQDARQIVDEGRAYLGPWPVIVAGRCGITHANAAARALGIVPDGEQQ